MSGSSGVSETASSRGSCASGAPAALNSAPRRIRRSASTLTGTTPILAPVPVEDMAVQVKQRDPQRRSRPGRIELAGRLAELLLGLADHGPRLAWRGDDLAVGPHLDLGRTLVALALVIAPLALPAAAVLVALLAAGSRVALAIALRLVARIVVEQDPGRGLQQRVVRGAGQRRRDDRDQQQRGGQLLSLTGGGVPGQT